MVLSEKGISSKLAKRDCLVMIVWTCFMAEKRRNKRILLPELFPGERLALVVYHRLDKEYITSQNFMNRLELPVILICK